MQSIQVEQAIFASSDRGSVKGYQLVAKSSGVDRTISQELCRWAPTQMLSSSPADWTINYFPVSDDWVAVTRTVLGGPEYSSRGGTQVVTRILLLSNEQFLCYHGNPVAVVRTAMALGAMRLPANMTLAKLDPLSLPARPLEEPLEEDDQTDPLIEEIFALIRQAQRVAVIGLDNPLDSIARLMPRLSVDARRECSFTTGLAPAVRRPFQTHFLPAVDAAMQRTLDSQNIVRVPAKTK